MSFVRLLQGIGDRLGILETAPADGSPAAMRIQTRSVSLQELTGEIKSGAVQSLADAPAELAVPFERIFEAAGISANPQDWTTDRLKQVIADEPCRNKPRAEAQKAVLALLNAAGISPEIIVKDAMARDQALDAYEIFARDKMQSRKETRKKKLFAAESRIRDLQEECRTLEKTMKDDEEKWNEWKKNKRARERELASIVSYIVDHKVITSEEGES
jgi:hypothetical protein